MTDSTQVPRTLSCNDLSQRCSFWHSRPHAFRDGNQVYLRKRHTTLMNGGTWSCVLSNLMVSVNTRPPGLSGGVNIPHGYFCGVCMSIWDKDIIDGYPEWISTPLVGETNQMSEMREGDNGELLWRVCCVVVIAHATATSSYVVRFHSKVLSTQNGMRVRRCIARLSVWHATTPRRMN